MKKLYLILMLMSAFPIAAGVQNGQDIPDAITLTNSSDQAISVGGNKLYAGQSDTFETKNKGMLTIKQGNKQYTISYPCYANNGSHLYETFSTAHLDFATIVWLAQNSSAHKNGIDEIEIENDTHYSIIIRYYLNKIRSLPAVPHKLKPQETTSKVVRDETGTQPTGTIEITDGHNAKYTITVPRSAPTKSPSNLHWKSIKLCANTIALFNTGFRVTLH